MKTMRVGGAVGPKDFYIERPADSELMKALRSGGLCHVISSSRTGKTSLALRALRLLAAEDPKLKIGYVDITGAALAAKEGPEKADRARFYSELAHRIQRELKLPEPATSCTDPATWQRFLRELRDLDAPVALALDETNSLLELPEEDREGFLATFKAFDADRALSDAPSVGICLLGYASPQALMTRLGLSPFNASHPILLDDFTLEDIQKAVEHEEGDQEHIREVLKAVYEWNRGHPYMTVKLINLALARKPSSRETTKQFVKRLVEETFLKIDLAREPVLDFAVKQLTAGNPTLALRRLELYKAIHQSDGGIDPDSVDRQITLDLQLAGLVISAGEFARLDVRNKVFRKRFGSSWVDEMMKAKAARRPFAEALEQWKASGMTEIPFISATDIEQEAKARSAWELSGDEVILLGRVIPHHVKTWQQKVETWRRKLRFANAALGVTAILFILTLGWAIYVREESDRLAIQRGDLTRQVEKLTKDLDGLEKRMKPLQDQVDMWQNADVAARKELQDAGEMLRDQRLKLAAARIEIGAGFVGGAYGESNPTAVALNQAHDQFVNFQEDMNKLTHERNMCRQSIVDRTKERDDCTMERDSCRADLNTRTTERDIFRIDLTARTKERDDRMVERNIYQIDLTTRTSELNTCRTDLATLTSERDMCRTGLATRTSERDICKGSLATCQTVLGAGPNSLTTCRETLISCTDTCHKLCAAHPPPGGKCPC